MEIQADLPFRWEEDRRGSCYYDKNSLQLLKAFAALEFQPERIGIHHGMLLPFLSHMNDIEEIKELLIVEGINVNAKASQDGTTCLHYAVINCSLDMVQTLIARGADLNQPDGIGLVRSSTLLLYIQTLIHSSNDDRLLCIGQQMHEEQIASNC
jgi:ankyrin repeat protein